MPTITVKWTVLGVILFLNHQASCDMGDALYLVQLCHLPNMQSRLTLPRAPESTRPLSYRVFKSNVMDVEINTVFCGWTYSHQRFLLLRPPLLEWESSCGSVVARKEVELLTKCWARLNFLKLTWIEISHINWYSSFYRVIGMGLSSNQLINW